MNTVFVELIVNAGEASELGIGSRDEIEEMVEEALSGAGYGEVTRGGGGGGFYSLDIELTDQPFEQALGCLRNVLRKINVPKSTQIIRYKPVQTTFEVYGD